MQIAPLASSTPTILEKKTTQKKKKKTRRNPRKPFKLKVNKVRKTSQDRTIEFILKILNINPNVKKIEKKRVKQLQKNISKNNLLYTTIYTRSRSINPNQSKTRFQRRRRGKQSSKGHEKKMRIQSGVVSRERQRGTILNARRFQNLFGTEVQ